MPAFIDRTGVKYNKLTVSSYSHKKGKRHFWLCICECGNKSVVTGDNLVSGGTKSCGCLKAKHGKIGTSEYQSWESMRQRCNNKNHVSYERYGGAGISVCPEWDDFSIFLNDLGSKPCESYTIDRIDCAKGYEPGNCRWASKSEQNINRKPYSKGMVKEKGVYERKGKYQVFLTRNKAQRYLGTFPTIEEAVKVRKIAAEGIIGKFKK